VEDIDALANLCCSKEDIIVAFYDGGCGRRQKEGREYDWKNNQLVFDNIVDSDFNIITRAL
jgi:hypothetical protein